MQEEIKNIKEESSKNTDNVSDLNISVDHGTTDKDDNNKINEKNSLIPSSSTDSNKKELISTNKNITPKKEIPIEKKPFNIFINNHLIPTIKEEFIKKGLEVDDINLKNTSRPIAGDNCWVIYCEIRDTCNFWLSFEKDDISSTKSISLSKPNQEPSIIESFLIDEKRITLNLIISRIFQRLNGQKLIGAN